MKMGLAILVVAAFGLLGRETASAQSGNSPAVIPFELIRPTYPPIAQSARVGGDVEVSLRVRSDGSIESGEVISGFPLLQDAALKAAMASRFECRLCGSATLPYTVLYSFRLSDRADERSGVSVGESQSLVWITAEEPVAQLYFVNWPVRSLRCLYLSRCGVRWGGLDFYYYPVRGARCLWLWHCDWRRRA